MKCIICGNELTGAQSKYCCKRCQQIGYKTGKSVTRVDTSKKVSDLYKRFLSAFRPKTYHGNGNGFYIRVFVSACVSLGYSDRSIAKGIGKERSNISRHRLKIQENEKRIAKDFLENKNYVYGSKYNGFSYGVKNDL